MKKFDQTVDSILEGAARLRELRGDVSDKADDGRIEEIETALEEIDGELWGLIDEIEEL